MLKNEGFTLIEVMVSIAIIGLILTALLNINIAGFKFMAYNRDRVELQNQARLINTNFERQIRKANSINVNGDTNYNGDVTLNENITLYVQNNRLMINDSSGMVKSITDPVIDEYGFNWVDEDKGLVYFYFKLIKDNSSYEITNVFYPRGKN